MNQPMDNEEFERRLRAALQASAEQLAGATRSRLTQARHVALAARRPGHDSVAASGALRAWRSWAPAGAAATAVLVMLMYVNRSPQQPELASDVTGDVSGALDDLELLADGEALELNEFADYEFYEWAASAAEFEAVGT